MSPATPWRAVGGGGWVAFGLGGVGSVRETSGDEGARGVGAAGSGGTRRASCSGRTRRTSGWDRSISERHVAYYERRAAGGAGVVVVEEASVHDSDWPYERCPLAAECGPGWAAVADAVARARRAGAGRARPHRRPGIVGLQPACAVGAERGARGEHPRDAQGHGERGHRRRGAGLRRGRRRWPCAAGSTGSRSTPGRTASCASSCRGSPTCAATSTAPTGCASPARCSTPCGPAPAGGIVGLRLSCDELAPWAGIVPEAAAEIAVELAPWIDYLVVVRGGIFSVASTRPDGHDAAGLQPRPRARRPGGGRPHGCPCSRRARSSTSARPSGPSTTAVRRRRDDPGPDRRPRPGGQGPGRPDRPHPALHPVQPDLQGPRRPQPDRQLRGRAPRRLRDHGPRPRAGHGRSTSPAARRAGRRGRRRRARVRPGGGRARAPGDGGRARRSRPAGWCAPRPPGPGATGWPCSPTG